MSEWRTHLIVNRDGTVNARSTVNLAIMLRSHPDMAGVLGKRGKDRMILRQPPWHGDLAPRMLTHTDHLEAKMWLEGQGFAPYTNQVISAVRHVCEENSE